jgi:hypothetical protein
VRAKIMNRKVVIEVRENILLKVRLEECVIANGTAMFFNPITRRPCTVQLK